MEKSDIIFKASFNEFSSSDSGSFKLLGIQYSLAKDDRYIDNYYSKLEKIKKLLNDWSLRNISLLVSEFSQSGWLKISSGAVDGLSQYLHNVK
jgi:hypothetical protein